MSSQEEQNSQYSNSQSSNYQSLNSQFSSSQSSNSQPLNPEPSITQSLEMQVGRRRSEYQNISEDFRKHIIRYYDFHRATRTFKEMAIHLRLSISTLQSIVKIYNETGRVAVKSKGGKTRVVITDEMLEAIKDLVDDNPAITLGEIQVTIGTAFNMEPLASITAIDYALKVRIGYTLKRLHKYPSRRNDPTIKLERVTYINKLMTEGISYTANCIFVDESGFNLWTTKGQARSKRGLPAFRIVSSNRKRNLSLIAAMSVHGVEWCAMNSTNHGTTGEVFADYMKCLYAYLDRTHAPNQTIIMDNCPIHRNDEVKEVMAQNPRHRVEYLPAWSPFLNPIEELFSKVKYLVKREHLDDTPTLIAKLEDALRNVEVSDCEGWVRHAMSFFPRVLAMEPML